MKKLIAALLAAALMTFGLVEATGAPSLAATSVKKVKLTIKAPGSVKPGKKVKVSITETKGAQGKLTVTVKGPGINKKSTKKNFSFKVPKKAKGKKLTIKATFKGKTVSKYVKWGNASKTKKIKVKKK